MQRKAVLTELQRKLIFILIEAGDPVVVFAPYEIASGSSRNRGICDQIAQNTAVGKRTFLQQLLCLIKKFQKCF